MTVYRMETAQGGKGKEMGSIAVLWTIPFVQESQSDIAAASSPITGRRCDLRKPKAGSSAELEESDLGGLHGPFANTRLDIQAAVVERTPDEQEALTMNLSKASFVSWNTWSPELRKYFAREVAEVGEGEGEALEDWHVTS